jgi:site-specific DNA-methyltransferase (adenine-specific)
MTKPVDDGTTDSFEWDRIVCGESVQVLKQIPDASVHLILSDIPYGIGLDDWDVFHDNTNEAFLGSSPGQKKAGAVFKSRGKPINGWSEADKLIPKQYEEWCSTWASEWLRILKPGGSAIVFAGRRYAHRFLVAMEDAGFNHRDTLAWIRPRATHRAQRISSVFDRRGDELNSRRWAGWRVGNLRPLFEPIQWLNKPYKMGGTVTDNLIFHGVGAYNEDRFVENTGGKDNILKLGFGEKETGHHPTQKPLSLMRALIDLTTQPGQVVIDPFCGSGSTLVAAKELSRKYLGIEMSVKYVETSNKRLVSLDERLSFPLDLLGGVT